MLMYFELEMIHYNLYLVYSPVYYRWGNALLCHLHFCRSEYSLLFPSIFILFTLMTQSLPD